VSNTFIESIVERTALAWLETAGWQVRNCAEIVPGVLRGKEAKRAIKETTV
jgi:hypothetical protein